MLKLESRPFLYTILGTLGSVAISYLVTRIVLQASATPMIPAALWLAVGLPLLIAPLTMYPLLRMVRRQHAMGEELSRLVLTDTLTGLPNRRAFFACATSMMVGPAGTERPIAAMMIDVDHFKGINDTLGHDAGDDVLKRVGEVINNEVRSAAAARWTVARIGGEEFAVLVEGLVPSAIGRLAERICGQVHRQVGAGEDQRPVTVSIGVALRSGLSGIDALLKSADDAVYAAKHAGRDRWAFAGDVVGGKDEGKAPARRLLSRKLPEPANDHDRAAG